MAPVEAFERMKAVAGEDGTLKPGYEAAPLRTVDPAKRMKENRMEPIPYTGDKGYKLGDVLDKKVTMEEFVAQLSDDDLICMFRGYVQPESNAWNRSCFWRPDTGITGVWHSGILLYRRSFRTSF